MKFLNFCNKTITYSFYALFFFVPLVFAPNTSELFELNKMWLTFILTIIIMFAWGSKMLIQRTFEVQRTPFDIPLLLFGLSQLLSTLFSLDQRVSWWGYYSRFNGGFLSTLCYILLYYAFVTNLKIKQTYMVLLVSLLSCIVVSLWGFPSHFGKDPTCLLIRGTFDVSCWTDQFQPKDRIFATLGQPAWMASYLAFLLPLSLGIILFKKLKEKTKDKDKDKVSEAVHTFPSLFTKSWILPVGIGLAVLFYLDLLFSNTKAGFLAFWLAYIPFWTILFAQRQAKQKQYTILGVSALSLVYALYTIATSHYELFWIVTVLGLLVLGSFVAGKWLKYYAIMGLSLLILTFFFNSPFAEINSFFSFTVLQTKLAPAQPVAKAKVAPPTSGTVLDSGGTESSSIRKIVWKGAIDAWLHNPVFGTGVETFAFAYYKYRPAEHNMTSEWDYLYNKAHNEYLNYLATTGLFGLGTYLAFIAVFLLLTTKWLLTHDTLAEEQNVYLIVLALYCGYITILVANFFGFSVVITNLYLFLTPLFVLQLTDMIPHRLLTKRFGEMNKHSLSPYQWTGLIIVALISWYMIVSLIRFWIADTQYALGHNLNTVNEYTMANPLLTSAVQTRPNEPVFTDELAINDAALVIQLLKEKGKDAGSTASTLAEQALALSTQNVQAHPNNILVWKNRVRILYLLAQANPSFYEQALAAIQNAQQLAPTDAKISYNLGVLYGQTGDYQKAITTLKQTIQLKPDYEDAYFAMGLFYHELASKDGKVVDKQIEQQAVDTMHFILKTYSPNSTQILDTLKSWGEK